jgi:RNA polymerase sigma-70 factor (ECF subfamily)
MAFFQDMLVEHLPHLRAFALRISRDRSLADDLVQETMLRALCNSDKFMRGTNMEAWLSTILRNRFYDELRSRSHFTAYEALAHPMEQAGNQEAQLEMKEFEREFAALPTLQREALSLVGVNGFSYEEAAEIVRCPQGTIKSRVCRARATLEQKLHGNDAKPSATPIAANEGIPLAA